MCLGKVEKVDNSAAQDAAERERVAAEKAAAAERRAVNADKAEALERRRRRGLGEAVSSLAVFASGNQDTAMRTLFSRVGGGA